MFEAAALVACAGSLGLFLSFFFLGFSICMRSMEILTTFFFGVIFTFSTALVGSSDADSIEKVERIPLAFKFDFVFRDAQFVDLNHAESERTLRRVVNQAAAVIEVERVVKIAAPEIDGLADQQLPELGFAKIVFARISVGDGNREGIRGRGRDLSRRSGLPRGGARGRRLGGFGLCRLLGRNLNAEDQN